MSYFEPPAGVATTSEAYFVARRNEALNELDRQLGLIVGRWSRTPVSTIGEDELDSARVVELSARVIELAARRLEAALAVLAASRRTAAAS